VRLVGRVSLGEDFDAARDRGAGAELLPVEDQPLLQPDRVRSAGEDRRGKALDDRVEPLGRGDRIDQLGLEPGDPAIPEPMESETWWRAELSQGFHQPRTAPHRLTGARLAEFGQSE
jgi:hypothetical protein